jgi:hypothetical protein
MAKTCSSCGAINIDEAKFCNECGKALGSAIPEPAAPTTQKLTVPDMSAKLAAIASQQSKRTADILFVLDCTSSMQGEIDAIQDAIIAVADTISTEGVRARVGLIEFRDRLIDEEHRVLTFNGEVFTNDPNGFRQQVSALKATGGGDEPESSLDALLLASRQPFAPDAQKVIVLITDAPPHIPDKEAKSIDEVLTALNHAKISQFYPIIRTQSRSSEVYLQLYQGRKGLAFDLGKGDDFRERAEHFKRTLMALGKTISSATA